MSPKKILIVEDEVLIADHIGRFLSRQGYQVVGVAISFEEAQQLYHAEEPDLVLVDIRLSGQKTGIDFAHYLRDQSRTVPFIYLTSQADQKSVEAAKQTYPEGYLAKPINKQSLYASVEMALHRSQSGPTEPQEIKLFDGSKHYRVKYADILYLEAEHVYVKVYLRNSESIMQRSSLTELALQLPDDQFVRTHRSYVINIAAVSRWEADQVYIGTTAILVSRGRRKEVLALLNR